MLFRSWEGLKKAVKSNKYGALTTWKQLFHFQMYKVGVNPKIVIEIGKWATKYRQGKAVLPLMNNAAVDTPLIETKDKTYEEAVDVFAN